MTLAASSSCPQKPRTVPKTYRGSESGWDKTLFSESRARLSSRDVSGESRQDCKNSRPYHGLADTLFRLCLASTGLFSLSRIVGIILAAHWDPASRRGEGNGPFWCPMGEDTH